jgi:uncharacterized membrane protein HdeD (DUF308 family)
LTQDRFGRPRIVAHDGGQLVAGVAGGIAAIAFGILAFVWPVITLLTLTLLWGASLSPTAFLRCGGAVAGPRGHMGARFWLVIVGLAGVVAGVLAFAWPGVTALVLLFFIAIWAIVIASCRSGAQSSCARKSKASGSCPERSALGCLRHTSAGTAGTGRIAVVG